MQTRQSDEPVTIIPLQRPGLAGLLEAVVAAAAERRRSLGDSPVDVTLDVAAAIDVPADPRLLRAVVAPLLDAALAASACRDRRRPGRAEVVVTVVPRPDHVEIEIADSGDAVEVGPAALAVLPAAERIGGRLTAARCPEGGSAVTLRLPLRRAGSRAA